ncbi:hypothetical protein EIMP300_78410 [Escherichia coli]|uniref:C-lysozyme inhibitor n=1 Tax=Escherichia coli TaxID=562 RepID=A0A8S0G2G9_ECOLX|nr:hypothetical protein EIMP300_78410 [Escherichia coli]
MHHLIKRRFGGFETEKLTWLNVNDALSIDGKTVLFAALTGSLENHPDGFNFK